MWEGAGSASYGNIIGVNPQLIDPDNGNYNISEGSDASEYGCQDFIYPSVLEENEKDRDYKTISENITFEGEISEDTIWDCDSVKVTGDITINNGIDLKINPGVNVIFEDFYGINVNGSINAVGTHNNKIYFKAKNDNFTPDSLATDGAWRGLKFINTKASNDSSKIVFCEISDAKELWVHGIDGYRGGGAVTLYNYSKILIKNSYFKDNYAFFGGAISCYYNSNPLIIGNIFTNNYGEKNGSVIANIHSFPKIINNTIVNNTIHEEDIFDEKGPIYKFVSKPLIYNNIIRNNSGYPSQIVYVKDYYTKNNNIEGYLNTEGNNIDSDPTFSNEEYFNLNEDSSCIDKGKIIDRYISYLDIDIMGNPRIKDESIDIGAVEFNGNDIGDDLLPQNISLSSYPNPFNPTSIINFELKNSEITSLKVYNHKGEVVKRIFNTYKPKGSYQIKFDGSNLPSGTYFAVLKNSKISKSIKMLLIK